MMTREEAISHIWGLTYQVASEFNCGREEDEELEQQTRDALAALGVTPEFTIRCRDRRYCANASTTITATDQDAAHMAARNQGWLIHTAADTITCPACQTGCHPRRTP